MLTLSHRPNIFQRLFQKLGATRPAAWLLSHILPHIDRSLDRLSRGRFNLTRAWSGLPVVMVTTIGARSGHPRTVPLAAIPDGNNVILIASWFGNRHHPAWYYNLIAHPDTTLADHQHSAHYQAREVQDSERETYWQRAVSVYAGYAAYKRRVKRVIPIMLLTPKD